jgi:hypothetical protein
MISFGGRNETFCSLASRPRACSIRARATHKSQLWSSRSYVSIQRSYRALTLFVGQNWAAMRATVWMSPVLSMYAWSSETASLLSVKPVNAVEKAG